MNDHLEGIITQLNDCKRIASEEENCEEAADKLDEAVWSIVSAQCALAEHSDTQGELTL